jgi:hypothetical protein
MSRFLRFDRDNAEDTPGRRGTAVSLYERFYAEYPPERDDDDRVPWVRIGQFDMRTGRLIR